MTAFVANLKTKLQKKNIKITLIVAAAGFAVNKPICICTKVDLITAKIFKTFADNQVNCKLE